jgi:hypothetical protein
MVSASITPAQWRVIICWQLMKIPPQDGGDFGTVI